MALLEPPLEPPLESPLPPNGRVDLMQLERLVMDTHSCVAWWDFEETAEPWMSRQLSGRPPVASNDLPRSLEPFPLTNAGRNTVRHVNDGDGPFGRSVIFDGKSWLESPSSALNVAKYGNEVTIVAWVDWHQTGQAGIAGVWRGLTNERSFALFLSLGVYGGLNRVVGEVSSDGRPTPGYPFSLDYSATARALTTGLAASALLP